MMGRRKAKGKRVNMAPMPQSKTLRDALRPFTDVEIPSGEDGECVWFYVGKPLGTDHGHLNLEDFRRARRVMK